jgi:predicted Na+-dependent transporter
MPDLLVLVTQGLLGLLFFGLSATVEVGAFRSKFAEKRGLACGAGCQFVAVPALGFLSTQLFDLPVHYGVTLLVLCSSPGGSYSNWWCSMFNADLALSVAMTATSTLLSVVMLPLNTLMYVHLAYGRDVDLDWASLLLSLLNTVVSISLGLYAGSTAPHRRGTFNAIGQVAGVLLMVISAAFAQKKQPIWDRDAAFYAATCLPFFFSAFIATVVAALLKLAKPEQVAVVIETCYQNIAFATTVAISTFSSDDASLAAGVPVLYGLLEVIFIAVWCTVTWQMGWTYAAPSEQLAKMLLASYQPGSANNPAAAAQEDSGGDTEMGEIESASNPLDRNSNGSARGGGGSQSQGQSGSLSESLTDEAG